MPLNQAHFPCGTESSFMLYRCGTSVLKGLSYHAMGPSCCRTPSTAHLSFSSLGRVVESKLSLIFFTSALTRSRLLFLWPLWTSRVARMPERARAWRDSDCCFLLCSTAHCLRSALVFLRCSSQADSAPAAASLHGGCEPVRQDRS